LFSSLKQLLFSPSTPPAGAAQPAPGRRRRPVRDQATALLSPQEIDAAFYGLILGVQSALESKPNSFERRVLRELERMVASDISHSSLVPRLPSVIPRVMSSLRDQDSSAAQLAAELGRDAVLVSEVIRLSNSALYRVGAEITSLERGVFTLGRTGIRQLVANAAFKPLINLNAGYFTHLSGTLLWEQSEKTAIGCDWMARQEQADRFHAYLAAIVQNVGLTVGLQVLDRNFDGKEVPHSQQFRERLIRQSRILTLKIARQWAFPPAVLDALEAQIEAPGSGEPPLLDAILFLSDKLAKLHILACQGRISGASQLRVPWQRLTGHCTTGYERLSA
jgi:HD-like signal output (HDOD) protein